MSVFTVLFIADICGKAGRQATAHLTDVLKEKFKADFVIANVENAAGGFGVTPEMSRKIFTYGVDVQTSGNHIWDRMAILEYIDQEPRLLRPDNYPKTPGSGVYVAEKEGVKIAVVNLMGRTYMLNIDCPFKKAQKILSTVSKETNIIFLDFHAEATSEKQAMLYHLDSRVSAIVGTHTHVQTADEFITENGTAYMTDAGMTGAYESVIGMEVGPSLGRFLTGMPKRFTAAKNDVKISGVAVGIDKKTGKAVNIQRYRYDFNIEKIDESKIAILGYKPRRSTLINIQEDDNDN
ncbi:MAG: TIGR00282 family metallophosphoesterase [Candidatus Zixiibacteriota bacterium]